MVDLRRERIDRGLSLDQLSEQCGVPKNTLSRVEHGAEPVPATKLKIANFYGCRASDIWPVKSADKESP